MTCDTKVCEISKTDSIVDEILLGVGNLDHLINIKDKSETAAANGESLPEPRQRSSSRLAERAATAAVLHANLRIGGTVTQNPKNTPMATAAKHEGLLERSRKLENENAMLHRLVTSFTAKANDCEARIKDLETALNACSSEEDENQRQLKHVLTVLDTVQKENDVLKKTEHEFELSSKQHSRLRKENEELKTRIFKQTQPDVVSDAQLNEKYENLCGDIEDWTDTHLGEIEDVVESVIAAATEDNWRVKFLRYFDMGLWEMLKLNNPSQLKFLACIIQRIVMHRILCCYAFGVSDEIVEGLSMIEKQMKVSGRDQDCEQIQIWRADTIRALLEAPSVVESCQHKLVTVTEAAWDLLGPLFPKTVDQHKAMTVFHKRITTMAWELSKQLRTSPVQYNFSMRYIEGTTSRAKALHDEDIECSILLDAGTGSKLRRSTDIISDDNGSFGQGLCVIFPALVRSNPHGQDTKIGKATVLVKLNKRQHASGFGGLLRTLTG